MKRYIFLYLLPISLVSALCIPIAGMMILMGGAMSTDAPGSSVVAAYLFIGILALLPIGVIYSMSGSWYWYVKKEYRTAIKWSFLPNIFAVIFVSLFMQKLWVTILAGLWLCIGFWLAAKINTTNNSSK